MSASYLIAAEASVSFLDPEVFEIHKDFPVLDAGYTETEGDLAETVEAEMHGQ